MGWNNFAVICCIVALFAYLKPSEVTNSTVLTPLMLVGFGVVFALLSIADAIRKRE